MSGMGAVERVLVLGIVVVIVAILGIAVWGAAGDEPGKVVAATDGGAVVTAPGASVAPAPLAAPGGGEASPISGIDVWRQLHEQERAARNPGAGPGAPGVVANNAAPGAAGALGAPAGGAVGATGAPGTGAPATGVMGGPGGAPPLKGPALETSVTVQPGHTGTMVGPPIAAMGTAAAPRETKSGESQAPGSYTVVSGDSLWKIAHRMYGDADIQSHIDAILAANPKINADNLKIGQKLTLPGKVTTDVSRLPAKQQVAQGSGTLYEVQSGDTLSAIARKKLGDSSRWKEIYELNRERIADPANIYVGTTLRLPKN